MQDDLAKIYAGKNFQAALRLAEKIMDYRGPDDPRPLIYTMTHHVALGMLLGNKPHKGGRPTQWDAVKQLRLWAEVERSALKGISPHSVCHAIARDPRRWKEYPLTPKEAQSVEARGKTLHKRYLMAKKQGPALISGNSVAQRLARAILTQ